MTTILRIFLFTFALILFLITTIVVKKGRIPIKYSLLWYICSFIVFIVALVPQVLDFFANLLGFTTISSLIVGIFIALLLFLTMSLTIISAGQKKKITLLIQEVSILKRKVENKE